MHNIILVYFFLCRLLLEIGERQIRLELIVHVPIIFALFLINKYIEYCDKFMYASFSESGHVGLTTCITLLSLPLCTI